jgi:hypothetical protein
MDRVYMMVLIRHLALTSMRQVTTNDCMLLCLHNYRYNMKDIWLNVQYGLLDHHPYFKSNCNAFDSTRKQLIFTSLTAILSWNDLSILIVICLRMQRNYVKSIIKYIHGVLNLIGFKNLSTNYLHLQ